MKLHFRYHTYLYAKKGGTITGGCKYCQDRSVNGNGRVAANENENEKSKRDK
jgi:hypothetical protein